ncbi:PTS sugar transporter subunit IIB [Actinomyces sp. Z5]|uniref:PTS sugar transporter subunit IIB n=1 Tax=Actinomyces sp. Z5 TaxID=2250216 RepID=UPI0015EC68CF|nr:PTS sugar transporter subunit IIB [Actinomyces sp. Z5]
MNITCVCGMGIGTSMLLKMNVEQAAASLGLDAEVSTSDIGTAKGAAQSADLIITSAELAEELTGLSTPVAVVRNFTDISEIEAALKEKTQ